MTNTQCLKTVMVSLWAVALLPAVSLGGWVLKDKDGSTTYIEDGRIKQVEEDGGPVESSEAYRQLSTKGWELRR